MFAVTSRYQTPLDNWGLFIFVHSVYAASALGRMFSVEVLPGFCRAVLVIAMADATGRKWKVHNHIW